MRSALILLVFSVLGCGESAAPTATAPTSSASLHASATETTTPATSATTTRSVIAPAEAVLPGVLVQLERGACYGTCPSYVVTVFEDGRVEYEGRDYVVTKGKKSRTVDVKTIEAIKKAFDDAKFLGMGDYAYDPSTDPTDGPTYTLYYASGGVAHRLQHYSGSAKAPATLGPLEGLVDASAGTETWIGTDAERSKMRGGAR